MSTEHFSTEAMFPQPLNISQERLSDFIVKEKCLEAVWRKKNDYIEELIYWGV